LAAKVVIDDDVTQMIRSN